MLAVVRKLALEMGRGLQALLGITDKRTLGLHHHYNVSCLIMTEGNCRSWGYDVDDDEYFRDDDASGVRRKSRDLPSIQDRYIN